LEVAWQWETGESPIPGPIAPIRGQQVRPGNFEATPLAFNDTLYVTTPYNRVIALDGSSGETIWDFDPRTVEWGQPPNGTGFVHRGVAVWNGSDGRRIFLNTRWRLIAIDGATGEPIESFGHRGEVDLTEKLLWRTNRLHYTQTSPPVVFEDLLIIGNGVWDGFVYPRDPPGNIQAFDVRTGELVWSFNLIPQPGEPGNETWEDGSWDYTGHTNAWAPMVVDEERGLLYAGIGTPSNDYYGGHRKGDNLYAESLVALDARTGELAWHFQTIHHGLWDFDLPGAPVLLTVERDGDAVDAVAVAGKTGFVYTFDRGTGDPVWPIEERPVPLSDVHGEVSAALREAGLHARRPDRPHSGTAPPGRGTHGGIPLRPPLRASLARRDHCDAGDPGRRQLGRRRLRPALRLPLRQVVGGAQSAQDRARRPGDHRRGLRHRPGRTTHAARLRSPDLEPAVGHADRHRHERGRDCLAGSGR
ncbi:MAG: PQQ-binding-like beta-propeller repeat protein, partial [Gemmatimonadetes bacterium]|nr:PQQ-binding-like beta-propeller repeat protein [Gemmatimonadota bacterium]